MRIRRSAAFTETVPRFEPVLLKEVELISILPAQFQLSDVRGLEMARSTPKIGNILLVAPTMSRKILDGLRGCNTHGPHHLPRGIKDSQHCLSTGRAFFISAKHRPSS